MSEQNGTSRRDLLRKGLAGLGAVGAGCLDITDRETGQRQTAGQDGVCDINGDTMELVFEDDFRDDRIDAEKWRTNYPWDSRVHNYDGYASSQNVYLYDGKMIIMAEDRPQRGRSYTTGMASPRRSFSSGYVEGLVKVPPARPGFWPAFWLTPDSASDWYPEIDLFEFFGADPRAWMSYHYWDENGEHQRITSSFEDSDFGDSFHRYAVDWNSERIIWYIDGKERFRYSGEYVRTDDMWLILNFGIGPDFLDPPSADDLPARLEIGSIRVWERDGDTGGEQGTGTRSNADNESQTNGGDSG